MQWYKRWEKIREQLVALPPVDRPAWWSTWDALGVSPWDQHEGGGIYHPEGTLFDVACLHDPAQVPHLLERPVEPDERNERQAMIDRACYEAWHRADAAVFDHLVPLVQPWPRWLARLQQGALATKVILPSSMAWIQDDGSFDPHHPGLMDETTALLAITAARADTQAWALWSVRYAHRPAAQDALDRLWLGSSAGRVLDAMMIKVEDPAWALWALQKTTLPDRFCESAAAPLLETMVSRIAQVALPQPTSRPSSPAPAAWFDSSLRKLDALINAWGLPEPFTEPVWMGMNTQGTLEQALPVWQALGHPALSAMVAMIESHWLSRELDSEPPAASTPRPRL